MNEKLVNLTPHAVVLRDAAGVDHTFAPRLGTDGKPLPARVQATPGGLVDLGLPVPVATPDVFGAVLDLPNPEPETFLLVSAMVGSALAGSRPDVLVPGTGPADGAVRNEKGHVVAVTRLKRS